MKNFITLSLLLLVSSFLQAQNSAEIDFTSAPQPGMRFHYNIRCTRTRNCELKLLGTERPPVRRDTEEIIASGELFYKRCERKEGNAPAAGVPFVRKEFELRLASLSGNVNGKRVEFPRLSGQTVRIVFFDGKANFELLPGDRASDKETAALLGGAQGVAATGKSDKLEPGELRFLKTIFAAPDDPVSNWLGSKVRMEQGKHAPMNPAPILAALQSRGIPADRGNVETFAEYAGKTSFYGFPVHRVNLLAQGMGIPGYDFKFEASLMMPAESNFPACGPVRISRRVMEIVSTMLTEDNPLFSGVTMETVSNDMTDLILIPVERLPK